MNYIKIKLINICIYLILFTNINSMEVNTLKQPLDKKSQFLEYCFNETQEKLKNGSLYMLDPLIGDTACQTRAIEVALIYKQFCKNKFINLQAIIEKDIIASMFLLTLSKTDNSPSARTNYKNLNKYNSEIKISANHAQSLIKSCQQKIAQHSVKFLQDQAELINANKELKDLLANPKTDNLNRPQVAFYASLKLINQIIIKNKIPVILKIERCCSCNQKHEIQLAYRSNKQNLILCTNTEQFINSKPNKAAIIIQAYSKDNNSTNNCNLDEYIQRLKNINIETILLSSAASHPQFSKSCFKENETQSINQLFDTLNIIDLKHDFNNMIDIANNIGCTKDNSQLLLIVHIYCDTLKNIKNNCKDEN